LEDTHGDAIRHEPLGPRDRIEDEEPPSKKLDAREPTWKEVQEVVRKARSASAPGPNTIPYKKCPKLLRHLWNLMKVIWRKGKIPSYWQRTDGYFVPKEEDSKEISQLRTISLLNVEGKIFFAVLARRLTTYMTGNSYVDTSVQKGRIPGFSRCIEQTSITSQLIGEAKVTKGDLTVIWLNLANA